MIFFVNKTSQESNLSYMGPVAAPPFRCSKWLLAFSSGVFSASKR